MTMKTKDEVFREHVQEWLKVKGNRKKRSEIAKHIVFATKCHPKSVSRTFKRLQLRDPAWEDKRGRPRYYDAAVIAALRDVWEVGDRGCGEVLHPMIRTYTAVLKRDGMWTHGDLATAKLLAMSERTVKRRLVAFRTEDGMRTRAQWNKGQEATRESIVAMRARLPFPLRALHPDSGGEFINWHLKGWCDTEKINLSRSEPYRKNDNMYVEERNGHVVRKYIVWERLDNQAIVPVLNEPYGVLAAYLNHWKASRRMIAKERVGAKYIRTYEKRARTPYERAMTREDVADDAKAKLRKAHDALNPLLLLKKVATLKKKIYELAKASRNRAAVG